jgi:hypothetical protein
MKSWSPIQTTNGDTNDDTKIIGFLNFTASFAKQSITVNVKDNVITVLKISINAIKLMRPLD